MLLLAALLADTALHAEPGKQPTGPELQLQLARSERFYLELDPARRSLRLRLEGVALRSYPLLRAETGVPRIAFVPLAETTPFGRGVLPAVHLEPPRPEMRLEILPPPADADSTSPPLQLPPRFDEMPVPWTYRLGSVGDFTLVVTSPRRATQASPKTILGILRDKLVEVKEAFSSRGSVLRLTLSRADAEHLYRALPPDTSLLVLAP